MRSIKNPPLTLGKNLLKDPDALVSIKADHAWLITDSQLWIAHGPKNSITISNLETKHFRKVRSKILHYQILKEIYREINQENQIKYTLHPEQAQ